MSSGPWGVRFQDLKVIERHIVTSKHTVAANSEEEEDAAEIRLTALDQSPFLLLIAFTHYIVLENQVPAERLLFACQQIAEAWPVLAGRSSLYPMSSPIGHLHEC